MTAPEQRFPRTIPDYLAQRLGEAGAVTRALAWDPEWVVFGTETVVDSRGRVWQVLGFDGDRPALLRAWSARRDGQRTLIDAAPPRWNQRLRLDLSYLPELAAQLELFVDLRLHRVLEFCVPDVRWHEQTLKPFAQLIAGRIDAALRGELQLRAGGNVHDAGGRTAARAIALAAQLPEGEPATALVPATDRRPWETVADYLRRALDPRTPAAAQPELRALAQAGAATGSPLSRALTLEAEELGAAVYVLALTSSAGPVEASRALDAVFGHGRDSIGAIRELRPSLLTGLAGAQSLVELLDERLQTRLDGETVAGSVLGADELDAAAAARALGRLPARAADCLLEALVRRGGARRLDELILALSGAVEWSPAAPLPRFPLAGTLAGLGSVLRATRATPPDGGPEELARAWVDGPLCCAEMALSTVRDRWLPVVPETVRPALAEYAATLRGRLKATVDAWDRRLAAEIQNPVGATAYHAEMISLARASVDLRPAGDAGAALFLVVLDGMRYDTWQQVVRPVLEQEFDVRDGFRLATLPSITTVSRAAFFAGRQPDKWRGPGGAWTSQERDLLASNLGLGPVERANELHFEVHASDNPDHSNAAAGRRRFNGLVYNVCDELVHAWAGSVATLQSAIGHRIRDEVLPDLRSRVRDGDSVIVVSDHGFVSLDPADATDVGDAQPPETIYFRHLLKPVTDTGIIVDWGDAGRFQAAIGRAWFKRPGGAPKQFAHGGVSLDELVVPAAVLQRISAPVYSLRLERTVAAVPVVEGDEALATVVVENDGNRSLRVHLSVVTAGFSPTPADLALVPGERQPVRLLPFVALREGEYVAHVEAGFRPANEPDAEPRQERLMVRVRVEPDPRRVEQSHALDIFDVDVDD